MSNAPRARALRMDSDQAELAERIAQVITFDGRLEVQPGIFFNRATTQVRAMSAAAEPSFCVIAQGTKVVLLGDERFRYDSAHYLISTMDLPLCGEVTTASPERPYLSFRLVLDPMVVTSMLVEAGHDAARGGSSVRAVNVSKLDADLLDATLRLVRLVEDSNQYRVLAPLIIREIVYRLLTGAQGNRLRHLAKLGGQAHRMVHAVEFIRANFTKSLKIEEVAKELHMSVSGFHAHFKAVTAMTPLQFQKQLRLQEARRLMLSDNLDAAQAGFHVGYDDASHFNREYKRQFGKPPMQDIDQLRNLPVS